MRTSNELYKVNDALVYDAKESIMDILSKQPKQRLEVEMYVVADYGEVVYKEKVVAIRLEDDMIELILTDDDTLKDEYILSSEWLYILECVEYELEEREERL